MHSRLGPRLSIRSRLGLSTSIHSRLGPQKDVPSGQESRPREAPVHALDHTSQSIQDLVPWGIPKDLVTFGDRDHPLQTTTLKPTPLIPSFPEGRGDHNACSDRPSFKLYITGGEGGQDLYKLRMSSSYWLDALEISDHKETWKMPSEDRWQ